jgi:hypothetical protein
MVVVRRHDGWNDPMSSPWWDFTSGLSAESEVLRLLVGTRRAAAETLGGVFVITLQLGSITLPDGDWHMHRQS